MGDVCLRDNASGYVRYRETRRRSSGGNVENVASARLLFVDAEVVPSAADSKDIRDDLLTFVYCLAV